MTKTHLITLIVAILFSAQVNAGGSSPSASNKETAAFFGYSEKTFASDARAHVLLAAEPCTGIPGVLSITASIDSQLLDLIEQHAPNYFNPLWNMNINQYKAWIATIAWAEAGKAGYGAHSGGNITSLSGDIFRHKVLGSLFHFSTGIGPFQLDRGSDQDYQDWQLWPTGRKLNPEEAVISALTVHYQNFPSGYALTDFAWNSLWLAVNPNYTPGGASGNWVMVTGTDWVTHRANPAPLDWLSIKSALAQNAASDPRFLYDYNVESKGLMRWNLTAAQNIRTESGRAVIFDDDFQTWLIRSRRHDETGSERCRYYYASRSDLGPDEIEVWLYDNSEDSDKFRYIFIRECNKPLPEHREIRADGYAYAGEPTLSAPAIIIGDNFPVVNVFNVTPISVTLGNSFTISYTVSDDIGLNRVELWRAVDENGDGEPDWPDDPEGYIDIRYLSGQTIDSNSFSDIPSVADTYWYGLHVVDNAEQLSFEPDPPGPMERTVTTDTTPPSPDPMTWLSEPYQTSTSSISMVATTASDESAPISYYFDFYSSPTGGSGGTDSGWQTSRTYSVSDLQVNHQYGYRVKARDSVGNETAYSSTSYEYTDAKVPGTASFSDVTGSSIQVNWTTNGNPSWTEYFCENVTNGTNSGWTTSTHWDDTELISETEYCYQVKTRNGDGEETGWTNLGCETTLASKIPLMDLNHDGMMNLGDFAIFGFFWMNDTCCDPNWCEGSDSDQSGMVNFLDLSNFVDDWLWQYWTVIQLTDNSEFDLEHDVSGSSIVWMGGGISEDYEIFLYDGTKTTQVTNNGYDDVFPGVSGTNIAWLGQVDADGEIFLFDGTTTTRLTDNSYQEGVPRVSGSHVVWEGYDGNDDEIFLYDGTSLTQLTDNGYADEDPRVSGSNVVWRGLCDPTLRGEIFLYDGTSTTQLTNDTNFDLDPDVSGSNVVWVSKDITSEYEIFLYDGTDTIQLTNNTYRDFDPHVSGYNVVWKALIGGDWEIFFYDGTTTIQLTDNSSDDEHPRVSGSIVVWHGWDGNDKEIFIYDGTSTIQLTDNNYDDEEPEVSGSTIVWRGWDGNDWEIFMAIPTDTIF